MSMENQRLAQEEIDLVEFNIPATRTWEEEAARRAAQSAVARHPTRTSTQRVNRTKSRKYAKHFSSKGRPGISVDTSFSRHRGEAPRLLFASHQGGPQHHGGGNVDSLQSPPSASKGWWSRSKSTRKVRKDSDSNIVEEDSFAPNNVGGGFHLGKRTMRSHKREPSVHKASHHETQSPEGRTGDDSNMLAPLRFSVIDISPSDRPIQIGFSIPSSSIPEHSLSPETATPTGVDTYHASNRNRSWSESTTQTPTIIITPAGEKSVWSPFSTPGADHRPRPASSVYSQATAWNISTFDDQNIPPVPPLPHNHLELSRYAFHDGVPIDDNSPTLTDMGVGKSGRQNRVQSGFTVFEEDDTPKSPPKEGSRYQGLKIETDVRASRSPIGWWNFITTPFESSRPNSKWTARSPPGEDDIPPMPEMSEAFARIAGQNLSPLSPQTAISPYSGQTTISSPNGTPMIPFQHRGPDRVDVPPLSYSSAPVDPRNLVPTTIPTVPAIVNNYPSVDEHNVDIKHTSVYSILSPNDRDVPFVLSPDLIPPPTLQSNNPYMTTHRETYPSPTQTPELDGTHHSGFHYQNNELTSPRSILSPSTSAGDFTPVVATASVGAVMSARNVEERQVNIVHSNQPDQSTYVAESSLASSPPRLDSYIINSRPSPPPRLGSHTINSRSPPQSQLSSYTANSRPPSPPRLGSHTINSRPSTPPRLGSHTLSSRSASPAQLGSNILNSRSPSPPREISRTEISQTVVVPPPPPVQLAVNVHTIGSPSSFQSTSQQESSQTRPITMLPRAYSHYSGTHAQYDFGFAGNGGNVRSGTTTPTLPSRPHPKPRFNFKFPCWGQRRRNSRDQRKNKKKRRWLCCILLALIVIIILIIVLILTLGRGGAKDDPPTQSAPEASPRPTSDGPTQGSQWLTISGFPPIPTGVSTIARPDPITQKTGCVKPSTMWSCALPKEEHDSISPNDPNQPNFKVEILFQNATARDLGTGSFAPSPPAPNLEDLAFIGNTTDQNVEPFEGEETPFFITLLSPRKETPSRVVRRQEDEEPTSTSNDFNIVTLIPPPSVVVGGVAAPAELLPLPESQPLRLYNRGEPEEHYGFYTYFDRSIFMKNINIRNDTENDFAAIPADQDGGSTIEGAQVRCTWAQTRFLVQIWTNSGDTMPLLGAPSDSSSTPKPTSTFVPSSADAPTANDFDQPGSFPYPVTITLDRHGGDLRSKMLYCYGMDNRSKIIRDLRKFYIETRDFGGELVNPAGGPFSFGDEIPVAIEDGGPGGIDGGNGGCSCQWANWRKSL